MRVNPVSNSLPERRVHFNDVVEVRIYIPDESHPIEPTMEAKRIERAVKAMPNVQGVAAVENNRAVEESNKCWKNSCHTISLCCGVAFLPSFVLLTIGPIGLIAPASLLLACFATAILGGKPTPEMESWMSMVRRNVENTDYR